VNVILLGKSRELFCAFPSRSDVECESRFQRWRFLIPQILGRYPRLAVDTAPLALEHVGIVSN
jgi:hypothetical protein